MMMHQRTFSEIELATSEYFDASMEALEMCRQLLQNIKDARSNYQSMDSFLASISASDALDCPSASNNPFGTTTRSSLRSIHDKYSLVVVAGGVAAAAAFSMGAHLLLFGLLVIGTATTGVIKTWLATRASTMKPSSKTMSSLLRLQEQLDTVAKGSYVLGQDLDTVSSLVARLSDAIEWENTLARWYLERADERTSVLEMANELRRSCSSSRTLTEELEEHVCMFLATIHRARNLVIQEISKKA